MGGAYAGLRASPALLGQGIRLMPRTLFTLAGLLLAVSLVSAADDPPKAVPLWSSKVPYAVGDGTGDKPSLTAYLAPKDKANGTAVVVCPGGGYGFLAM